MNKPIKTEIDKVPNSYTVINFGYGDTFIFPYDEGIKVIAAFKNAEQLDTSDYENKIIIPIKDSPTMTVMSKKLYAASKMAALLGVTIKEFQKSQEK